MESSDSGNGFIIWGVDYAAYGPVELPTLVEWVRDERVTAETWVYSEQSRKWQLAPEISELQMFFRQRAGWQPAGATPGNAPAVANLRPGTLRRVKIFAELSDDQLERFVGIMEVRQVRQFAEIVKQGEQGDSMFLVLDGELRVRMMIAGKETILTTLGAGEFFGEVALFDHGPRSADVVANRDSTLLKISADTFQLLIMEQPDVAAQVLFAIGKTLIARIRADNKRFRDSVSVARAAGSQQ